MQFLTSRDELRALYKSPGDGAVRKELKALDAHSQGFIAKSPFVLIGSSDGKGNADVTPKGDRPGFVAVLDNTALAIPDRPGNNRLDSLSNVVANPGVGLLFLVPGVDGTLRVNGTAAIHDDDDLRARFTERRPPATVIAATVREAYLHCAKALMRSRLWDPEAQIERSELPTLGEMLRDQLSSTEEPEPQDEMLERYKAERY